MKMIAAVAVVAITSLGFAYASLDAPQQVLGAQGPGMTYQAAPEHVDSIHIHHDVHDQLYTAMPAPPPTSPPTTMAPVVHHETVAVHHDDHVPNAVVHRVEDVVTTPAGQESSCSMEDPAPVVPRPRRRVLVRSYAQDDDSQSETVSVPAPALVQDTPAVVPAPAPAIVSGNNPAPTQGPIRTRTGGRSATDRNAAVGQYIAGLASFGAIVLLLLF
ncbi:Uncharacterized protein PBTT_05126 [Plasmodiophora brassicae]